MIIYKLPPCDDGGGDPGWVPEIPTVPVFDPSSNYLELDQFVPDVILRNQFKSAYNLLELKFQSLPVNQYTYMNREDFLQMLQNNPDLAATIDPVTILVKVGINAAADVLTQIFFIKLTDPNVNTWGQAFGQIDWWQVGATAATCLLPWNTTSGKFIVSAINGATAVISDLSRNGFTSWGNSGVRFAEGFCASLVGNYLGEVATKFGGINNFGKALITRLDNYFPYRTVCKWLGGGLVSINKSFSHTVFKNGIRKDITITSTRMMKGWDPNKIAVIGRNMEDRVKPFANKLSAELDKPVVVWTGFNDDLSEAQNLINNRNWIKSLKEQGYTIYDVGLDPY